MWTGGVWEVRSCSVGVSELLDYDTPSDDNTDREVTIPNTQTTTDRNRKD